jgi:SAM-dependent methyltransferase
VLSGFRGWLLGRALEVGAGIGNFTRWLAEEVDQVVAIEPDPIMSAALDSLELPNVEVRAIPVDQLDPDGDGFDCAVLINVLEHLVDERGVLEGLREVLRPGAHLCMFVPAHSLLYGPLDRRYGHLRRYTVGRVRELLTEAGYTVCFARYFNPLGAVGWLLVVRLGRRLRLSRRMVLVAERVGVPVGRLLEKLGPPPFGQSVMAVARVPRASPDP